MSSYNKVVRLFSFLILILVSISRAIHAQDTNVIHYLLQPSGATPRLLAVGDKLITLENSKHLLKIFDLVSLKIIYQTNISGLPTAMTSDGQQLAFCDKLGAQINILDLNKPEGIKKISLLPKDEYEPSKHLYNINCSALSLEPNNFMWISSPGSQEIVKINHRFKKIRKTKRVSGSTSMKKYGPNIFTLNDVVVMSDAAVPYIMNEDGKSLVGDPMGEGVNTQLTRGYAPLIFVDEPSFQVYYAKPRDKVLHSFSMIAPNEKEMKEIPVSVGRIRSIARYQECLLVAGQSEDDESAMEFSLVRFDSKGGHEVWYSSSMKLEGMAGLREIQVSANHRILVSDWLGVHEIKELFSDELCR